MVAITFAIAMAFVIAIAFAIATAFDIGMSHLAPCSLYILSVAVFPGPFCFCSFVAFAFAIAFALAIAIAFSIAIAFAIAIAFVEVGVLVSLVLVPPPLVCNMQSHLKLTFLANMQKRNSTITA